MKQYHYTYRITNIILNLYYYGTRSTNINPNDDLGTKYFSSSTNKEFMKDQKENPQNYKYKVIKTFRTRDEAINLEIKLHSKFNVKLHKKFYNKSNQTSSGFDVTGQIPWNKGLVRSDETKRKISEANLGSKHSEETKKQMSKNRKGENSNMYGKYHTEETKKKISKANSGENHGMYGTHRSDETKKKISETKKGIPRSEETKKKLSESNKGNIPPNKGIPMSEEQKIKLREIAKNRPKLICPHCSKMGDPLNMKKWHFDNCKFK